MQTRIRTVIHWGLYLVPFIPFLVSGSLFFPFITTKAFVWRFIVEIILAAWAILALSDAKYRPNKSGILYAIVAFLVIIGVADLFGVEPLKSFWSNFERMEGFVSLLHLGAYFLVISSVFDEHDWKRWWHVNLFASLLMVFYCTLQLAGSLTINQGGARVDGTFGNASYLAVYMLFNIFIAFFYWWRSRSSSRFWYLVLIALELWILYSTATRGAILGLLGGATLVALLNVRSANKTMKKVSVSLILALVVVVGGFFALKDSSFVKNSPVLSRFATISTEELKSGGRSFVWPMAIEGIKEKPILGWGQDNFNYVFNEHYSPKMYNLEPWFDRAHNIFLDWGIAGGLLGLLAYLSLYVAALWLLIRSSFSYEEKTIITGLLAAYFFHNFFVFDQLISYIFFFSLLAYLHFTATTNTEKKGEKPRPVKTFPVNNVFVPVVVVLLVSLYFINVKPMRANLSLINALQNVGGNDAGREIAAQKLEKAYTLSRLGRPETVEQISQHTFSVLSSGLSDERKNSFYKFAKGAVLSQVGDASEDARYRIVAGSFLGQTGSLVEAAEQFKEAKRLIPGKQIVYFEYGNTLLNQGDKTGALALFKEAYDLAPEYVEAKVVYLIGAIYNSDRALEERLIKELGEEKYYFEDRIVSAYYLSNRKAEAVLIITERLKRDPANAALYTQYLDALK